MGGLAVLRPKQTCADCHFFLKEVRDIARSHTLAVHDRERSLAKAHDFSWVGEKYTLSCSFGVWDEGFDFDPRQRGELLVETDRRGFCFFWKYRRGMFTPAAKLLQEREAGYTEARKERRLTLWGLWIAAFALAANAWLTVAEHLGLWPFHAAAS
jgi:hypothetical protein